MQTKRQKLSKLLFLIFGLLFLSIVGFSSFVELQKKDLSPEDSKALYGGNIENNAYPYAGYLISYGADATASICGTVYLDNKIAISAAHCFDQKNITYLGYSVFNFEADQNFLAVDRQLHPKWNGNNVEADLAVINLPEDFFDIKEYAQIGSPNYGCNYDVIGYGKTENDTSQTNLNKLRKKATFCIETIEANVFRLRGKDGGICFGDSGSPIFEKNTNKVVGIISSIIKTKESGDDPCSIGNLAIAHRIDSDKNFLEAAKQNLIQSNATAFCGESCNDKLCSYGLTCNQDKICTNQAGNCISSIEGYCSDSSKVGCESGLVCTSNKCSSQNDVEQAQEIMTSEFKTANLQLEKILTLENIRNTMIIITVCVLIFAVVSSIKETINTLKLNH